MNEETQPVQDRPTENGIKLNNILTFLVLGVMSWVGINITQIKDSVSDMRINEAVTAHKLSYLDKKLDEHITDDEKHFLRYKNEK